MRAIALELKHELDGLAGVVERNVYLTRRYIYWDLAFFVLTVANTLTIVFIAEGIQASGGEIDVDRATTTLLIGAVVWAYLGIIFEFLTRRRSRGALGGHDRVHVHGAAVPGDAPRRIGVSSPCSTASSGRSCCSSSSPPSSACSSTTRTSSPRS